jgi:aminoglycoside 6'-N-acetyltransferase
VDPGRRAPEFVFRPLDRSDLPLLAEWLGRPHVARWWREPSDLAAVEATYGPLIDGSDPTEGFIATYQGQGQGKRRGQPLAFLQRYRLDDDPEWQRVIAVALAESGGRDGDSANDGPIRGGVGIDYLIGEQTMTGRGLGRQMIDAFVDLTWDRYPDITAVVVAVDQRNEASWRALEGAAFLRTWAGMLDSDDPSDQGPHYIYVRRRSSG